MSPRVLISNTMAGTLIAVINITVAISVAALIFAGARPEFFATGVTILLVGTVITGLGGTLASGFPGIIVAPRSGLAPVFAGLVAAIIADMGISGNPVMLPTIVATIMVTTAFAGLFLILLGQLKLGSLVRYIPYPVMGGFFAGIGFIFIKGGISVATGEAITLANLATFAGFENLKLLVPATAFAICLYALQRRTGHWAVFPSLLAISLVAFFAALSLSGTSIQTASSAGWLPQITAESGGMPTLGLSDLDKVDWSIVANQAGSILVVTLLCAIILLLDISGIEIIIGRDLLPDRELKVAGVTNLINGFAGGFPGVHVASDTAFTYKLGGDRRLMGLVYAGAVSAAILAGTGFIGAIPTFVLGGLLLYVGIDFLFDWAWNTRKELPLADYLIILVILVVVAATGILQGVAFGFAIAVVLFVVNYSRLSIIKSELLGNEHASHVDRDVGTREILNREGDRILILQLQGFIFFGTADKLISRIRECVLEPANGRKPEFLVLDFHHVSQLDTSATRAFAKLAQLGDKEGLDIAVSGYDERILARLNAITFFTDLASKPKRAGFDQIDDAVEWCEERLLQKIGYVEKGDEADLVERLSQLLGDPTAAAAIAPYFTKEEVASGVELFQRGDEGDYLYLIHSGSAVVMIPLNNGRQRIVRIFRPGSVVGEMALYTGAPRSASVRTEGETVLFRLDSCGLSRMQECDAQATSKFHAFIVRLLAERLDRTNRELRRVL